MLTFVYRGAWPGVLHLSRGYTWSGYDQSAYQHLVCVSLPGRVRVGGAGLVPILGYGLRCLVCRGIFLSVASDQ